MLEAPRMTYYARVIDNLTNKEILEFSDVSKNNVWYYGKCDLTEGGESEYLIEFDIWNNELAFNAGMYDTKCKDAKNCRLTIWPTHECIPTNNSLFNLEDSFMYARCMTLNNIDFQPIKYNNMLRNIVGNVNPKENSIKGSGDHSFVQTKIVLPENTKLPTERHGFVFAFYYDFD